MPERTGLDLVINFNPLDVIGVSILFAVYFAARILNLRLLTQILETGAGSFLISNNASSLRGRKRLTGQSLYYPRVMMRTLAQVLTEEYSEHGVHVANVVIDGLIDSPGTRALPRAEKNRRS